MADEKLNTGPEAAKTEEAPAPVAADPARSEAPAPEHQPEQAGPAEPGDVVISADQIDALMADKRRAARAEVEKAETPPEQEAGAPSMEHPAAEKGEPEKPRRGRPPKSEKAEHTEAESEKAARLRLTRRPPAKPSRPNETNCPEVAGKRPRLRLPRMPGKVLPQRRLLPRSRPRRSLLCRPVPLRRASWFI